MGLPSPASSETGGAFPLKRWTSENQSITLSAFAERFQVGRPLMTSSKKPECPKILAVLMNLCNALPHPYIWPLDYERKPGELTDWSIPQRPLEARLIHPEVIKAEVKYFFNVAFAYDRDPAWAADFEEAFLEKAGQFEFVRHRSYVSDSDTDPAGELFGKFLVKHGRKVQAEMETSLLPYTINLPLSKGRESSDLVVGYKSLLAARIESFKLPAILIQYLNGEIEPFTNHGAGTAKDLENLAQRRWVHLWNAYYNLGGLAQILDEPRAGYVTLDTGRHSSPRYVDLYVDGDGIVRVSVDDVLLQILTHYEIPADRIKTCKECRSFFWAKRVDQKCCSTKCSNAYRVRNFRQGEKDKARDVDDLNLRPEWTATLKQIGINTIGALTDYTEEEVIEMSHGALDHSAILEIKDLLLKEWGLYMTEMMVLGETRTA